MAVHGARWLTAAALLAATAVSADQQMWLELEDAQRGAAMIPLWGVVRHLCEPCGETSWREEAVRSVEVVPTGNDNWHTIEVNGSEVDLAYLYVETDGGWRNLALMLGLQASGVSATLAGADRGAPEPAAEGDDDPCANAQTTIEMLFCAKAELTTAEDELDRVYRQLMETLEEPRRSRLRDAQRAWLAFRDACADFEASLFEGGSMAPVLRTTELTHRTRARTLELRRVLEQGE
jgi:uncharacterized protein YecT (DUF1311 family)